MNRRYKGKKTEFGINSEFFKTLLIKPKTRYSFDRKALKIQKPQNQAEIAMLSKFIFGIELTCRFEYCQDRIADEISKIEKPKYSWSKPSLEDIRFLRYFKLYKLDPNKKDYIPKSVAPNNSSRDNKMVLVYLRYFCNVSHDDYNDYKFNNEVFRSSYELDSHFWIHCIGELTCGGIASCSYGQVEITSFNESQRILNIFNNPNEPVRDSFKREIDKLIKKNNKYTKDYELH